MKLKNLVSAFCILSITLAGSIISQADVLRGNVSWSRTSSYARGWRIADTYKMIGNAVLKDEATRSELTLYPNVAKFDPSQPLRLEVRPAAQNVTVKIFDVKGAEVPFKLEQGGASVEVAAGEIVFRKFGGFAVQIAGRSEATAVSRVVVETTADARIDQVELFYAPAGSSERVNIAPHIAAPRHQLKSRKPQVVVTANGFTLQNASVVAEFTTQGGLQLKSLRNEYAGKNILADVAQTKLFLTEINNKRFGAQQWQVQSVQALPENTVQVNLRLAEQNMSARLEFSIDAQGLKLGLQLQNEAAAAQSWKTVFPHLGGIAISAQPEDDYYLYPLHGGLVQKANAHLRHYYGAANESLWQMIDIFSPAEGTGVAVRSLDKEGILKGMAFRKGADNPAYTTKISKVIENHTSPDYLWKQSLSAGRGSTLGMEYSIYTRGPKQAVEYPEAIIEMHPGDWHNAMRTYADWAHQTWKWRPISSKLDDVWRVEYSNIKPFTALTKPLYVDGKWNEDFNQERAGISEWDGWWEWSEEGPFGESLKNARNSFEDKLRHRIITDPKTGKLAWMENRGETNRYNTSMGGLEAFKAAIHKAQEKNVLVQLYTSPMLASTGTSMGQYGPKYGVINPYYPIPAPDVVPAPREGYVIQYAAWRMCVDSEEYVDIVARNMARLVKDTNVDAIRLDEFGFSGFACYNPRHKHMFAENGQHSAMRAMTELIRRVHAAASAVKPDFVLSAEYPGADIMAASLDGALMSENRRYTFPGLRPLPVNIFRFYFPETKLFEYRPQGAEKIAFWNAVGTMFETYPDSHHRILKENSDAFRSRDAHPLVPTLVDGVYANRFAVSNKEITLIYNHSGKVSNAAVLSVKPDKENHYFDLLNGRELVVEKDAIRLNLAADDVAAVVRLPRVMTISKEQNGWSVKLSRDVPQASIVLCDKDGAPLGQKVLEGNSVSLQHLNVNVAYIKLFSGKYLYDASQLS